MVAPASSSARHFPGSVLAHERCPRIERGGRHWPDVISVKLHTRPGVLGLCQAVYVALYRRIEKVNDPLFEGEESIVHLIR